MSGINRLELKIPPVAVFLLTAGLMWGIASLTTPFTGPPFLRWSLIVLFMVVGGGFGVAGIYSFHCAKTTSNPLKPDGATSLVCTGVYRFTRNPMYLALLFALAAWAVFLFSAWSLFGLPVFVWYMNRFQIKPEERVLSAKFGLPYNDYLSSVRRWI